MTSRRTTKKSKAIVALLSGKTNSQAAQSAGVTERTIYRWLSERSFQTELREAERQIIESSTRQMSSLQEKAINVLDQLLESQDVSPQIRLRTANSILRLSLAYRDRNIERRLYELEELVSMFNSNFRNKGR